MKFHEVKRYKSNTPTWKLMADYYKTVAKDAAALGKRMKAAWYRKKADKVFIEAGGMIINC